MATFNNVVVSLLMISLILYTLLAVYAKMLTQQEMNEMIFGTVLLVFLFGPIREHLLPSYNTMNGVLLGLGFVTWYFWVKYIVGRLNKDSSPTEGG
jgi:hypothetical protein